MHLRTPYQRSLAIAPLALLILLFSQPVLSVSAQQITATLAKGGVRNHHRIARTVHGETDPGSAMPAVYIIQLEDAPLATYDGRLPGLAATSPKRTGARKLDSRSAASASYLAYLDHRQVDFQRSAETTLGRRLQPLYRYHVAFNGLAVKLTPQEAAKLVGLAGVRSVQRDQWRYPATDVSPTFLGVTGIWNGTSTGGLPGTKGEGVIVGVIDTGIWPEHPSFADDGAYPPPPASWGGECTPPADGSLPYTCNNKLIGVQYFLEGYATFGYDGLFFSGRDDDGHGTHTASTAAGNENVSAVIYGINRGLVSGMAPRAYVSAYKGLGPQGGVTSDLVAAIDKAVADGVDVINYSVGSELASDPWLDADAQAYLAALDAGVFVATSAGNAGPGPSTVGSPANAPWLTTVGASYFNRLFLSEISLTASGGLTLTGLFGATSTPGVSDFTLINAEGVPDGGNNDAGYCEAPFLPGTFPANAAVLCQRRGLIASWAIGNFVNTGGAGAVILYNTAGNYDFNSYLHLLPTVVVLESTGEQIKQFIADHPGETISVSFTQGNPVFAPDARIPVDTVVGFSSRGPNINESINQLIDVVKPDVTAPGIHVLAGASPQHVTGVNGLVDRFGMEGQLFQVIQGTSMSSPHVAGVGALIAALHPEWTPGQIRSALMTTALDSGQMARQADGDHPATPFDLGAGRIDLSQAGRAGFVLDENASAFAVANPAAGGDPSALNLASVTQANCLKTCTWVRTIRSSVNVPVEWSLSVSAAPTLTLDVQPVNFNLPVGGVQIITMTADVTSVPLETWAFGEVRFTPNTTATVAAHFPVAVRAGGSRLPLAINLETRREAGAQNVGGLLTIDVADLELITLAGEPQLTDIALPQDPTRDDPYDLEAGGVYTTLVHAPATAKRFIVEILSSTAPDLDLYVGLDTNGNGQPDASEALCLSTSSSFDELCEFPQAGAPLQSGDYWILIQNWAGSGAELDQATYAITLVDANSSGELSATGPASVSVGEPFAVQIDWSIPGFAEGASRFGVLQLEDASNSRVLGSIPITLRRLADDVTKTAVFEGLAPQPGSIITYTVTILPEVTTSGATLRYALTDTLPTGVTLVAGSATIPPTVNGNQLFWSVDVPAQRAYVMSTSLTDANCDTGFGGYIDLAQFGIEPTNMISGNQVQVRFDDVYGSTAPVNFFGIDYPAGLYVTDDGFVTLAAHTGANPGANVAIPNPAAPNNLIAPFWRDLEIVFDPVNGRGVTLAGIGDLLMAVEYDDVEPAPAGGTASRYDFEIIMLRQPIDEPGFYEIVLAYDNLNGPLTPGTIGLENADGNAGLQYAFNDAQLANGLMICYDWELPRLVITYQVKVDENITLPAQLVNTLEHLPAAPGAVADVVTQTLTAPDVLLVSVLSGPPFVQTGENITYTLTVSNVSGGVAPNVVAEAPLPPGTSYVSGGEFAAGRVHMALGDIAGKSSKQAILVVKPDGLLLDEGAVAANMQAPQIVGGIEAQPGAWPWQVAVMFANQPDGFLAQYCGGSLIARNWVLTAGHCAVFRQPEELNVAVGRHVLSSNQGKRIPVSQIVVYPGYTPLNGVVIGDVALLRLVEPVEITGTIGISGAVGLIELATPVEEALVAENTLAVVTGWGDRSNGLGDYADPLYQVTVPLVSNTTCSAAYDPLGFGPIFSDMLCAGFVEGGKDACYGDSGGPLVVSTGPNHWKQVGIVSSGLECAGPRQYGVYMRVPYYTDWIFGAGTNTFVSPAFTISDSASHSAVVTKEVVVTVVQELSRLLPLVHQQN
jgi:uncharacterized repeat protein (TIGR01451 family)